MGLSIRQATAEDLPAAVRLFEIRDGHAYEPELIFHKVGRFDPERTLAWMAYDGSQPVGMTMMLLRELDVDGVKFRAGYWANLYIHPEYRQFLLYPRLTRAMTGALRKNDLAILYTAVRDLQVAGAHVKLGFSKLGNSRYERSHCGPCVFSCAPRVGMLPITSPHYRITCIVACLKFAAPSKMV